MYYVLIDIGFAIALWLLFYFIIILIFITSRYHEFWRFWSGSVCRI